MTLNPQPTSVREVAGDQRPDISVLVTHSMAGQDVSMTLTGLTRQVDVSYEILICDSGDVAPLRRALDQTQGRFVVFVRAGELLSPGALRTLRDALAQAPHAGLAHALPLLVRGPGGSREEAHAQAARLISRARSSIDQRLTFAALPTFRGDELRASAFLRGGSQDEALGEAARAAALSGRALLIPRILCVRPQPMAKARWRAGLAQRLGRWRTWTRRTSRQLARAAYLAPVIGGLLRAPGPYTWFGALLRRASFSGPGLWPARSRSVGGERVAYVLRRYPELSQTFIRREVQALREGGLELEVLALEQDASGSSDDRDSPIGPVTYFGPLEEGVGRAAIAAHLWRQPWTVIRLWLFVVAHGSHGETPWWRDRNLLFLAGQLASTLAERGVTHVHAPWADSFAVSAFIASRLIGATFSVQARASEIHRVAQMPFVADRLRFASFVITNSRYNERYIRARLGPSDVPPIHVVYNGLDLSRFHPASRPPPRGDPVRLLTVGRLVEPKGLQNLLLACGRLRDRGIAFSSEIIGGAVEPGDTVTWVELRRLLTELKLEETVRFRGPRPFSTVQAAFEEADVFVLPCVHGRDGSHDITPNALIEAMAMGLPVISSTSGAIPEIVDNGVDGLLVPPGDVVALEQALERLILNPDLRRSLGAAARRKVEDRFDIKRNATRRVELFRALRRHPARKPGPPEVEESANGRA